MSQQSSIDFFHDAVNNMLAGRRPMTSNEVAKIWLEAKNIHKEEIIKANEDCSTIDGEFMTGEQYYKLTYENINNGN